MRRYRANWIKSYFLCVALFLAAAILFGALISDAGKASRREALENARESLRRAVVTCYAVEGSYPESYEYIKEHYGVRIDESRYFVHYEVFAANMLPSFEIYER
jgi:hypothetical protein